MLFENQIKKIKNLQEKIFDKLTAFFSNKHFIAFLFLYVFAYLFFYSHSTKFILDEQIYLGFFSFILSLIFIVLMFRFNRIFPLIVSAGALALFFSFFWQRFELTVEYNLLYYFGFGLIASSVVYSLIKENKRFLWLSMFLLFTATLSPLITPQILIGDERVLLSNLTMLESGEFQLSDFGEHNYVNVSFVYFYYLIIIAKTFGTTVANIFFILKFFFLLLIFLSFYLVSTKFLDEKLAVFAVLIAFFPVQNIHLAPQMIGKFVVFLLFIYFYLKYFKQLNSRIILVVMMIIITYINLTTLYISVAVFGFFVLVFFLKKTISRKAYFTDIAIFLLFTILVATYSSSINLFGLTEGYAGIKQEDLIDISDSNETIKQKAVLREEELNPKVNPFDNQELNGQNQQEFIPEKIFGNIPFLRRFVPFINTYVNQFGTEQLTEKLVHYSLVGVLILTVFFLYPDKRNIFILAMGLFGLILFLVHIQFQDGVHATLELTSVLTGICIVLVFHKKPVYFVLIMLLAFSSAGGLTLFNLSQYSDSAQLFSSEFSSKNIIGEKLTPVTKFGSLSSNEYYNFFGFSVSCIKGEPYDFYVNEFYLRCDDLARVGSIGKKIYENQYTKVYVINSREIEKFSILQKPDLEEKIQ